MTCRICLEEGNTIKVCGCEGTHEKVHLKCIREWHSVKQQDTCEICRTPYRLEVLFNYEPCVFLQGLILNTLHAIFLWQWRDINAWIVLSICFTIRICILCSYEVQKRSSCRIASFSMICWMLAYFITLLCLCSVDDFDNEAIEVDMAVECMISILCVTYSLFQN